MSDVPRALPALRALDARLVRCRACPRLVAFREHVASAKRRAYRDETYWGKPVTGFGDPDATLVILGLAPGAHGANRTGRVFTGDRSGEFLFAALGRAGLASDAGSRADPSHAPRSRRRDDGLVLRGVYVTLAARCVPPDNRPSPDEVRRCGAAWLDDELALLTRARVVLALGAIAWSAFLDHAARRGLALPSPRPRFAHDAMIDLGSSAATPPGGARSRQPVLVGSYHVSQQNTQTGRLTAAMFDRTLRQCVAITNPGRPSETTSGGGVNPWTWR